MWSKQEWAVFAVFFIFAIVFTQTRVDTNDGSRMNAVQSIVEQGTFRIDNSSFLWTSDKVQIDGHWYSDKPPISYLVAVPVYFILYHSGLTFAHHVSFAYGITTLLTVGLITSIMFVYFFRFLKRYAITDRKRWLYTIALGFGTQLLPFRLIYNNHAMGAALLFLSYYLWLTVKKPAHFFWSGLLAGFTAAIDLVSGGVFAALFTVTHYRRHGFAKAAHYALGACIFPIFGWLINYKLSGSFAYFSVQPALWQYPGTLFGPGNLAGVVLQPPAVALGYAGPMLIGWTHGVLTFNPLLAFGVLGILIALATKNKYRTEAAVVATGVVAVFLYYFFRTSNYGGCGWGFRYTVPLIPLVFVFIPFLLARKSRWTPWLTAAFWPVMLASVTIAGFGMFQPWACHPLAVITHVWTQLLATF
jgi:hypothetical protein